MRIKWIEHKGTKILFIDFSKLIKEDLLDTLYDGEKELEKLTSSVPLLLDFTGSFVDLKFNDEIKRIGKKYDSMLSKIANVGITGGKKILARAYNAFTGQSHKNKYFDNLDDARDFLCD